MAASIALTDSDATTVPRRRRWRRLPFVSLTVIALIVAIAVTAPVVAPADPNRQQLRSRLQPPLSGPVDTLRVFGTDQLGRDVLSRVMWGARVSLFVSAVSVAVAGLVGFVIGAMTGFFGGAIDAVLMRLIDLQLAFPFILLVMAIIALLGPTMTNIIAVFIVTSWPTYARVVRASVLVTKTQDFVASARAVGNPAWRVLFRHIAPNVVTPVIIIASFEMSRMIILESAIGFLGLGIPPPTPTWGNMLADGRAYIVDAWWLTVLPGAVIMLTTAAINFTADGIRDVLDPRFIE
jgi:peptide/nickel transport system permease protein